MDLTLNNPAIKAFFEKETDEPPVGEFIYVHTHFLSENFLSDIEVIINKTVVKLEQEKLKPTGKSAIALKIHDAAEQYALQCNDISEESAPKTLFILREIYQLCSKVLK